MTRVEYVGVLDDALRQVVVFHVVPLSGYIGGYSLAVALVVR